MERFLMKELKAWKTREDRKPLVLSGARQVGKTWLMKAFGDAEFSQTIYINFDRDHRYHELFERTLDPAQIVSALSTVHGIPVSPEDTLIIFDEVQEEPRALASLKYFCEDAPEYAIISAGSFMGIALQKGTTFPVGKVEKLTLYPLTWREFLCALGKKGLLDQLESLDPAEICSMRDFYIDILRTYYAVGGMPEIVQDYIDHGDYQSCRRKQELLIDFYRQDFAKHAPAPLISRLNQVWDALPSQLAKENRKFIYGQIEKGARAKEFETAIQWLSDCGLIHKVHRISKPGIPLKAYSEMSAFKIYLCDIGLLGALGGLPMETAALGNRLFMEFKGSLTEQYVLQQFVCDMGKEPFYYSSENSRGEVDFVLQLEREVIPVEVKAEENLRARSLRVFYDKYGTRKAVRISMSDFREQGWMVNFPLYSFMTQFPKVIG